MTKHYLRRWHDGLGCYVYLYDAGHYYMEYSEAAKLRTAFDEVGVKQLNYDEFYEEIEVETE